jgi:hypothetical protein
LIADSRRQIAGFEGNRGVSDPQGLRWLFKVTVKEIQPWLPNAQNGVYEEQDEHGQTDVDD